MINFLKQLFRRHKVGLKSLEEDVRDFPLGLFGIGYKPKHQEHLIKTLSVKDQMYNTCQWNTATASKEIDEKMKLSVRFMVAMGKKEGLISGDGFSNLRSGELILKKYGVCSAQLLPEGSPNLSWKRYSEPTITGAMLEDAKRHRTHSFWRAYRPSQAYKALDEGHCVKFGVSWRTSMNMSGGFSIPWLLNFLKGRLAGGHAILARGYKLNHEDNRVFTCQNSYGKRYGDKGVMYIKEEDFKREISRYGAYVNLDIPVDTAKWIIEHDNKIVKELNGTKVYLIEVGKKRLFKDTATMYAHGYLDEDIVLDGQAMLPEIEDGQDMDFWEGNHVKTIKALILRDKEIFKEYFLELFK